MKKDVLLKIKHKYIIGKAHKQLKQRNGVSLTISESAQRGVKQINEVLLNAFVCSWIFFTTYC